MKDRYKKVALIFIVVMGGALLRGNCAFARTEVTTLQKDLVDKALMQGVYRCYTGGYIKSEISPLSDYDGIGTLLHDPDSDENYVVLPTGAGPGGVLGLGEQRYSISDDGMSCHQFFRGGTYGFLGLSGWNSNIITATGHEIPDRSNSEAVEEFVGNMGYAVSRIEDDVCVSLAYSGKYKIGRDREQIVSQKGSNSVCKNSEGKLYVDKDPLQKDDNGYTDWSTKIWFGFRPIGAKENEICVVRRGANGLSAGGALEAGCTVFQSGDVLNGAWLQRVVKNACGSMTCSWKGGDYNSDSYEFTFDAAQGAGSSTNSLTKEKASFKSDSPLIAAHSAIEYLFNTEISSPTWYEVEHSENIEDPLAVNKLEKRVLYQEYLTGYYGVKIDCTEGLSDEAFNGKINWLDFNSEPVAVKICHYNSSEAKNKGNAVNGIDDKGFYSYHSIGNLEALLSEINNLETEYSDDEIASMIDINQGESEDPSATDTGGTCMSGAAGALGWIVCPVMEWMANASEKMYDEYIEPALSVDPKLFGDPGNSNAWKAWSIFQGFANAIFIIILLIVIFSQLTGVGIDNYGIKKILPKLIIAAVLVNLSYYICLICVDLSNIFGNGLQDMFTEMGKNLTVSDISVDGDTVNLSGAGGATVMTAMPILGALIAGGAAIYLNPAILLTLLISAIGIVVAIFFLFILLSVREAVIIVLTIISPIAFVLYMLPNTKKLFDKWLGIWKVLLLLYPICGLLVGGGSFVSKLLISSGISQGGFINAFMAMVVGIAPIFFIPTLLRNSLNALGSLGAKISGLGQRIGGGLQRGARNSEGYRNAQRMGLERRTRVRAGLDRNGNLTAAGERRARRAGTGFGRFFGMDKRQAAYVAQARKNIGESEAAGALLTGALARTGIAEAEALPDSVGGELGNSFGASTEGAYYGRQFLEAADAGNITDMNATIEAMKSSGMKPKDIAKLMRYANNHGRFDSMDNNTRAAWFRDLSKKYGGDFLATDLELSNYLRAGGTGSDGTGTALGNYGDYATAGGLNIDDIKPEDIVKLSGDSLAGLAASGKLDQSMAQRVLALNPNISADKRIMLGAIASGHATGRTYDARNNVVGNGSINGDVAQFKQDATNLMNDHGAGSPVAPATMNARGAINRATVEAWASATPQSVNVVQNFNGGGSQIGSVDVNLRDIGGRRLGGGGTS